MGTRDVLDTAGNFTGFTPITLVLYVDACAIRIDAITIT
jgi:hypothetical protein